MQSKTKIETIQYRTSRILEMKEDKYMNEKSVAKNDSSMQYFRCDMYLEKCFVQILNLCTGFLIRF